MTDRDPKASYTFECEGQAPENWEDQLQVLADDVASSVILTEEDYAVRVNALDDGTILSFD
ncbi:MAG TPA: hypothetical protein VJZ76_01690 [Thermoanaerobaculia bacterium]|nr:hypothetical protein [Thermoanaerobaculia bacterium]